MTFTHSKTTVLVTHALYIWCNFLTNINYIRRANIIYMINDTNSNSVNLAEYTNYYKLHVPVFFILTDKNNNTNK